MKKYLIPFILLGMAIAMAATYHTLPFNGTNTFADDEDFPTSTDTIFAYCTWDSQYLYLGSKAGFLSSENDTARSTYDLLYYIDTDPHPDNPTSGDGHNLAATYWTQIMPQQPFWFDEQSWTLPFNADYFIRGIYDKKDSVSALYGPWNEEKQTWDNIELDTTFANLSLNEAYYEVKVPWDSLGNPTDIFILGYYVSNEWKSDLYWDPDPQREVGGTLGSWPWSSIRGGDGDKGPDGHLDHWFHFHIQSGISPDQENDPPVVSDIPGQSISQGDTFAVIDLNSYVFDDITPDTLLNWSVSGNTHLTVTIGDSNQAAITVNDANWTGSDTLTFTAADQGGKTNSDTAVFTVNGPSALRDAVSGIPVHFSLKQNYPNPFNPVTHIRYQLAHAAKVKITVYNALGQKVATLVNAQQQSGHYKVTFNGADLASGVYVYRMSTSTGFVETKKMILIK